MLLTTDEFNLELSELGPGEIITDDMAATIASWYQPPGTIGRHLAAFASGAPVSVQAILDNITSTQVWIGQRGEAGQHPDLSLLLEWCQDKLNHPGVVVWCGMGHHWLSADENVECIRCGGQWEERVYVNTHYDVAYESPSGQTSIDCPGLDAEHGEKTDLDCNCIFCES